MQIKTKCPQCEKQQIFDGSEVATNVYDRKCRRCKTQWRVIVSPIGKIQGAIFHKVDWTPTK